jgi:hypothetical protein
MCLLAQAGCPATAACWVRLLLCAQLVPTGGSDLSIRTTAANGKRCRLQRKLCRHGFLGCAWSYTNGTTDCRHFARHPCDVTTTCCSSAAAAAAAAPAVLRIKSVLLCCLPTREALLDLYAWRHPPHNLLVLWLLSALLLATGPFLLVGGVLAAVGLIWHNCKQVRPDG